MNKKAVLSVFIVSSFVFLVIFTYPSFTSAKKQSESEVVVLDGVAFDKEELSKLFLGAVMPDKISFNSGSNQDKDFEGPKFSIFKPENLKRAYPWIYKGIYPDAGELAKPTLSKWNKSIRISFGMPNDLKPFEKPSAGGQFYISDLGHADFDAFIKSEKFPPIEKNVILLSSELGDLTGLSIQYIPHDQETVKNYAEIRIAIISIPNLKPDHQYKTKAAEPFLTGWGIYPVSFRHQVERLLVNKFLFTPTAIDQVDGFFLTDNANNITKAFCYLWQGHSTQVLNQLIKECLVRSLGFPSLISESVFNNKIPESLLISKYNNPAIKSKMATDGISQFDRYLITTLYRSSIKAGASDTEIQSILTK